MYQGSKAPQNEFPLMGIAKSPRIPTSNQHGMGDTVGGLTLLIPAGSSSFLFGLRKKRRASHGALSAPERITVQSLSQGEKAGI